MSNLPIIWIISMVLIWTVVSFVFVFSHETAHSAVCEQFGGKPVNMTATPFGGQVICTNLTVSAEHRLAQANVDAIGYQGMSEITAIFLLVFVAGMMAIARTEEWENPSEVERMGEDVRALVSEQKN